MLKVSNFADRPTLTHLKRLTTKDGLIQHADREVPDPSFGYSIDDNARALIACLWHYQLFNDEAVLRLGDVYFNYIKRVEKDGGSFHNFLSFTEQILDDEGSDDSIGRAIWALGETIKHAPSEAMKNSAKESLEKAVLEKHLEHAHVRTKAYILLGLIATEDKNPSKIWADKLVEIFTNNATTDWQWFENSLRYANGILPYALAAAYRLTGQQQYLEVAERSYTWLDQVSRTDGLPAPIGQNGWYFKGREKAVYDQQPLEAANMVMAATELFLATKNKTYQDSALFWMSWYDGNNVAQVSVTNKETGGVFDGITPGGVNENQGAESIVTYLLAYLSLAKLHGQNE